MLELVVTIISLAASWRIYQKMGRKGWEGIVPFYNTYVLFEELYGNGWRMLLMLIPIYNIYLTFRVNIDLAAEFHYNESYLSRMFQEQAGRSFSETVKDFKLRKAAELLKTRKWKLDHICEEIGYKDTRQFIRSFKKMYGITPDKFRKRVQIES